MSPKSVSNRGGPECGEVGKGATGDRLPLNMGPEEAMAGQGRLGALKEEPANAKLPTTSQLGGEPTSLSVKKQMVPGEVSGERGQTGGGRVWAKEKQLTLSPTTGAAAENVEGPKAPPAPTYLWAPLKLYPRLLWFPAGASGLHSHSPPTCRTNGSARGPRDLPRPPNCSTGPLAPSPLKPNPLRHRLSRQPPATWPLPATPACLPGLLRSPQPSAVPSPAAACSRRRPHWTPQAGTSPPLSLGSSPPPTPPFASPAATPA